MKNIFFAIFACLLLSCATKKQTEHIIFENYTVLSQCPEAGTCGFSIAKDAALTLASSGNGALYYRLTPMPGNVVVKYTYNKKINPAYADGSYREEFLFETDENFSNLKTNNSDVKKIFGLHCFCKGKAGYYTVNDAVIQYENNTLRFTVPAVTEGQVITKVEVGFE